MSARILGGIRTFIPSAVRLGKVQSAHFAAVSDKPPDGLPADDPEYSEDATVYRAVRRVYRASMHSVAFFDADGDAHLLSWQYHPHARTVGQRAILMRFAGVQVLIEGRHLRQLYVDIARRHVAEFRIYRPVWKPPEEGEPLIERIDMIWDDPDAAAESGQGRGLAVEAGAETRAEGHG